MQRKSCKQFPHKCRLLWSKTKAYTPTEIARLLEFGEKRQKRKRTLWSEPSMLYVLEHVNKAYEDNHTIPTMKYGGMDIYCRGSVSYSRTGALVVIWMLKIMWNFACISPEATNGAHMDFPTWQQFKAQGSSKKWRKWRFWSGTCTPYIQANMFQIV